MTPSNRSQPVRVLLEGSVIVVSILLAFAIDAGWDRFQQRAAERDAMRTLAAEFTTNLELTRADIAALRRSRSSTVFVLESARSVPTGSSFQVPDTSVVRMLAVRSLNPSTGALDGVLGSQGLDLFSDPTLRSRVAAWSGQLRDVLEDQAGHETSRQISLIPVLGRQGDISTAMEAILPVLLDRASGDELNRTTQLVSSTELLSVLGSQVALSDRSFLALSALEAAAEEIIALLPPA